MTQKVYHLSALSLPPLLTGHLQREIDRRGTPLAAAGEDEKKAYMLLEIEFIPDPQEGTFIACIPTINAFGEGQTKDEAALALTEALRALSDTAG